LSADFNDQKMNFFRFYRQGLTALSVFLLFAACDKLLPPSGNAVDIPVTIRAVSIAGGAQNQTVTRASGEKRITGQPVTQDLGGGMLAEITVEEDLSALRAGAERKLTTGAKLRIIALNKGTSAIYSWADYTATSSGEFSRVNGNLHVVENTQYDFVCYSFNTSDNLAGTLTEGGTLSSITVYGTRDFLYKKWTASLSTTNNTLSFTLEQQLAKVKLVLNGNGKTIKSVGSIKISPVSTPTTFNFSTTNALSGTTAGAQSFTGWGSTSGTTRQDSLRLLPTSDKPTLSWDKDAIITSDGLKLPANSISFSDKLVAGANYTVRITLKPLAWSTKFAGSNIYWNGSKLTFDEHGSNSNTKYQGVYFKWGSLIGVSPVGSTFSSGTAADGNPSGSTINGTPIYMKNPSGVWVKTNVAYATAQGWFGSGAVSDKTGEDAWSPIPAGPYGEGEYTLLTNHSDFAGYRGDICNYINPAYRMPTSDELKALGTGSTTTNGNYTWTGSGGVTSTDATGKQVFTNHYGTFRKTGANYILPASGYRHLNYGALDYVGNYGYYWSGSAYNSSIVYYLEFGSSNASTYGTSRDYGFSVRCVLQE
jgi:uncharacterized protein (TIGR02145 family)